MNKFISNLKNNRYLVQIVTLISGTLLAQIISLISIPILTRLYTPDEFGLYSIFFAITSVIGMVSSFSYEQAIVLPKSERSADAIVMLSIYITSIVTLSTLIAIYIFSEDIAKYFMGSSYIIYLIPISVATLGINQIVDAYSTRGELYREIASSKVITSSTSSISQISTRYLFNIDWVIIGKIFGEPWLGNTSSLS